jgi:hypothetical protein
VKAIMASLFPLRKSEGLHQALRGARGLYNHFRHNRYDPEGVQGWAHWMVRTNGLASDAISLAHRAFVSKERYGSTHGVLGTMDAGRRREIVRTIRRDGYYKFPEILPAAILDPIENVMRTTAGVMYPVPPGGPDRAVYDPASPLSPAYYFRERFVPEVQRLMSDENFVAIATDYIGVDPILHTVQQWVSPVFGKTASSAAAQLYHFDISNLRWLKIFVYLSDVTPKSGPHCLIRGTHHAGDRLGAPLRRKGAVRFSDEEIEQVYGTEREIEVTGPRGTVFCVDTRSCHKGMHPIDKERLVMEMYYVNSTFGIPGDRFPVTNPTQEYVAANKRWPRLFEYFPPAST